MADAVKQQLLFCFPVFYRHSATFLLPGDCPFPCSLSILLFLSWQLPWVTPPDQSPASLSPCFSMICFQATLLALSSIRLRHVWVPTCWQNAARKARYLFLYNPQEFRPSGNVKRQAIGLPCCSFLAGTSRWGQEHAQAITTAKLLSLQFLIDSQPSLRPPALQASA